MTSQHHPRRDADTPPWTAAAAMAAVVGLGGVIELLRRRRRNAAELRDLLVGIDIGLKRAADLDLPHAMDPADARYLAQELCAPLLEAAAEDHGRPLTPEQASALGEFVVVPLLMGISAADLRQLLERLLGGWGIPKAD
jgi:hypothetical protein